MSDVEAGGPFSFCAPLPVSTRLGIAVGSLWGREGTCYRLMPLLPLPPLCVWMVSRVQVAWRVYSAHVGNKRKTQQGLLHERSNSPNTRRNPAILRHPQSHMTLEWNGCPHTKIYALQARERHKSDRDRCIHQWGGEMRGDGVLEPIYAGTIVLCRFTPACLCL